MKIKQAIQILKDHNQWRQGDSDQEMIHPKLITQAIETVIEYFNLDNET